MGGKKKKKKRKEVLMYMNRNGTNFFPFRLIAATKT